MHPLRAKLGSTEQDSVWRMSDIGVCVVSVCVCVHTYVYNRHILQLGMHTFDCCS